MTLVRDDMFSSDRFTMILLVGFSCLALLLSAIRIYGVMNFFVSQRSHELAIGTALSVSRTRTIVSVLKEGAILTILGVAGGLVAALMVNRTLHSVIVGVGSVDLASLAVAGLLMALTAAVASYVPARRAAKINPMEALRGE
jgi:ABC-type antimicrobial peptide transport system permease subunit